ncbi:MULTISPECIES: hypothetical protein [Helicobacter]|uniref:hypothetical protein n=1 Tax=Helicobacter TaxID=209 RepID=UPI000EAEC965|nr:MULTISPECIES: hypothetical protein [Helicobacter]
MSTVGSDSSLFDKGCFVPIDRSFVLQGYKALSKIADIQRQYNKLDNDSFLNELRDSMIALYLGYDCINTDKHGLDAKKAQGAEFLEIKQVSFSSQSWSATFNDTTLQKAWVFKDHRTTLAVGVWESMAELLFIVYGRHKGIGEYLERKIVECKQAQRRSTQTISVLKLLKDYAFRIKPIADQQRCQNLLELKYGARFRDSFDGA